MTWRTWRILTRVVESLKLALWWATFVESMWCLSQKNTEELSRENWVVVSKTTSGILEFDGQVVKSKVDKSSLENIFAEECIFLAKVTHRILIFGLSTDCLKLSKFFMWFSKQRVNFGINFHHIAKS